MRTKEGWFSTVFFSPLLGFMIFSGVERVGSLALEIF